MANPTDRETLAGLVERAGGNPWFAADLILEWLNSRNAVPVGERCHLPGCTMRGCGA